MKTFHTALAAFLFLFAFSCTKENAGNSSAQSKKTSVSSSQSSDAESAMDANEHLVITGSWILYYSWYCTGVYSSTSLEVHHNNTWETGTGYTGAWVLGRSIFMRKYDNSFSTVYSGLVCSKQRISGIMTTWDGNQGCFYMVPATDSKFKGETNGTLDESGKPLK